MKRSIFLGFGLAGIVGLTGVVSPSLTLAEEGKQWHVNLPIKRLTREMEHRVTNMIGGVLEGNLDYVKQEAGTIPDLGKKILENFFPRGQWFMVAEALNPEETKKRREVFTTYINKMDEQVKEIQKAADSNNEEATLSAITVLIEKTCLECHKLYLR
ncbi:MAG: cytochrome c [Candidatus Loosdrechtia sp.]|uniref:cytochrome c n=1 Tax=Candidatus Loosdrechtia sp. TaxID=3101272 RepID=UPI003A62B251|nr:MAG: cytochrome c [Candidatus Jettenia sp. AMX2]